MAEALSKLYCERLCFWRYPLFQIYRFQNLRDKTEKFQLITNGYWLSWQYIGVLAISLPFFAASWGKVVLLLPTMCVLFPSLKICKLYSDNERLRQSNYWNDSRQRKAIRSLTPWVFLGVISFIACSFAIANFPANINWGFELICIGVFILFVLWAIHTWSPQSVQLRLVLFQRVYESLTTPNSTRRIMRASSKEGQIDSAAWRSRDDFSQMLLRWAVCEVFFLTPPCNSNEVMPAHLRGAFFIWQLGPIFFPLLILILLPIPLLIWNSSNTELLSILASSISIWGAWSVVYFFHLGHVQLEWLYTASPTPSILKLPGVVIGIERGFAAGIERYFLGKGFAIFNIIIIGIIPTYLQLMSSILGSN